MNIKSFHPARFLRFQIPWTLFFLEIIHFGVRWALINSPFFTELDYDESIIGLMALHILRGEPQLMLWGQPRMGGLEAYLASFLFYLFGPSTQALQLSLIIVSSVLLLVIYGIGGKIGGPRLGFMAAGYWALPPIFLSFTGNYVTGGHLEALLFGAFILYGATLLSSRSFNGAAPLIGLIGILAGIGGWSSLLIVPFLLAAALGIMGTRPRIFLSPLPWIGVGGYLVGSLPFWIWNTFHNFDTLVHLGGKSLHSVIFQLHLVIMTIFPTFIGTYWDGQTVSSQIPQWVTLGVLTAFFLPVMVISLCIFSQWIKRIVSLKPPFRNSLDYVVLILWSFILVRATGEPEELGLTRYTTVIFVPLSVLLSFWIMKLVTFRKSVGIGFFCGLLAFNFWTNFLYLDLTKNQSRRPVDDLIKAFQKTGIRYCYGNNRVTQLVTFESQENIIVSDYFGIRNYNYLRTVDQAPVQELALLAHKKLGDPFPETLEGSLQLLGGCYEKKEVGNYVFWYHFHEPGYPLRSLPADRWRVTSSNDLADSTLIKDRNVLTAWRSHNKSGEWLQIDLGQLKRITRFSILPGPVGFGWGYQFRLEISRDKKSRKTLREVKDYVSGFYWYQGRPKREQNPRLQIVFPPHEGRYLRITNLAEVTNSSEPWTVAEIFVYEASPKEGRIPEKAQEYLARAEKELDHWMDDPTGPHPLIPRLSMDFRKKQVNWNALIQSISQAIHEAPDWEEAHQVFVRALALGDMLIGDEVLKGKSRKNPLDLFPKRLSKIDSGNWRASSNVNTQEVRSAIDGNPSSRWSSLKNQEPGMFLQLDLGRSYSVNGFSLFLGNSLNDTPRNLLITASSDGKTWRFIQGTPHTEYAFDENRIHQKTDYYFSPTPLRYLKLVQTGKDLFYWWSIYEVEIFGTPNQEPLP